MRTLLKIKIWRIENSLKALVKSHEIIPIIWSFGAYWINPKHLVFVVGVPTDEHKVTLKTDKEFIAAMRHLLDRYNWPEEARAGIIFDIESTETVTRESNGNWWHHYK